MEGGVRTLRVERGHKAFKEGGWSGLAVQGVRWPRVAQSGRFGSERDVGFFCLSFALCPLLSAGAIEAVSYSNDRIKAMFLHKLVTGEWSGTMNLTEPQAGSDLSTVTTKAGAEEAISG